MQKKKKLREVGSKTLECAFPQESYLYLGQQCQDKNRRLERPLFWKSGNKDSKSGYTITNLLILGKLSPFSEPQFVHLTVLVLYVPPRYYEPL